VGSPQVGIGANSESAAASPTHYSKSALARDGVAKHADTVELSNFKVILNRIAAVVADYAKAQPGITPSTRPVVVQPRFVECVCSRALKIPRLLVISVQVAVPTSPDVHV
jgi:hypothetical protein